MGFWLETNGVHWYFKDSVQTKYGNPYIWYTIIYHRWLKTCPVYSSGKRKPWGGCFCGALEYKKNITVEYETCI